MATPVIESVWVQADQDRLQQAVTIVLDNAIRYSSSPGKVPVGVELEDAQQ